MPRYAGAKRPLQEPPDEGVSQGSGNRSGAGADPHRDSGPSGRRLGRRAPPKSVETASHPEGDTVVPDPTEEIDSRRGVAETGVHSLAADRGELVGGVAAEKEPTEGVPRGNGLFRLESTRPERVLGGKSYPGSSPDRPGNAVGNPLLVLPLPDIILYLCNPSPPPFRLCLGAEREGLEGTLPGEEKMRLGPEVGRLGKVEHGETSIEEPGWRHRSETSGFPPGTVTPQGPGTGYPGAVLDRRGNAVCLFVDTDYPGAKAQFNGPTQAGEALPEKRLSNDLRHRKNKGKGRR